MRIEKYKYFKNYYNIYNILNRLSMKTSKFYYLNRSNPYKYLHDIKKFNLHPHTYMSIILYHFELVGFSFDENYYLRRLRNVVLLEERNRCLIISSFEISRALTPVWKPRVNSRSSRHISSVTFHEFGMWRVSTLFLTVSHHAYPLIRQP